MKRLALILTVLAGAAQAAPLSQAYLRAERRAGETLAGVLEYQGGFAQLEATVVQKEIVRSFRVAIPKFCKDVEILEAGTITEGEYDVAKLVVKKDNLFSVNAGTGSRIGGLRALLNGPKDTACSIPVFISSKKATPVSDPGVTPGVGTTLRANICNRARKTAWIAIAYHSGGEWQASGWWKLDRGQCSWVSVRGNAARSIYLHGKSSDNSFWGKGDANFCVKSGIFDGGSELCETGGYAAPFSRLDRAYDGNYYLDLL